jgi:phosphatidylglycerophosphate synthase
MQTRLSENLKEKEFYGLYELAPRHMDHAIIIAVGTGIDNERLNSFGETAIGGIFQIKRLIAAAEKAGIKSFTVIVERNNSRLEQILRNEKRIKSRLTFHSLGFPIKFGPNPSLILQSNLIISPAGLSDLMTCKVSEGEVAFLADENKDPGTKAKEDSVDYIFPNGGKAVGVFVAYGSLLEKLVLDSMDLTSWALELAHRQCIKSVRFSDGYWMRLSSDANSIREAENLLYSNIRKSERGWMSRNINRRISIPISRFLIRTSLTPNMVTMLVGIVGVLSGIFYALKHPIWGGIFLEASSILDGCDGEVAKIKLMESKRGQWFDTIFDQLSYISFVVGVPIGYYSMTKSPIAIVLGGINLGILLLYALWGFYFVATYADTGSMVSYPKTVDKLIPFKKRAMVYKLIVKLRPLLQRQYFSFLVLVASVLGGYPLVLSMTTLGLGLVSIHLLDDFINVKYAKLGQ